MHCIAAILRGSLRSHLRVNAIAFIPGMTLMLD